MDLKGILKAAVCSKDESEKNLARGQIIKYYAKNIEYLSYKFKINNYTPEDIQSELQLHLLDLITPRKTMRKQNGVCVDKKIIDYNADEKQIKNFILFSLSQKLSRIRRSTIKNWYSHNTITMQYDEFEGNISFDEKGNKIRVKGNPIVINLQSRQADPERFITIAIPNNKNKNFKQVKNVLFNIHLGDYKKYFTDSIKDRHEYESSVISLNSSFDENEENTIEDVIGVEDSNLNLNINHIISELSNNVSKCTSKFPKVIRNSKLFESIKPIITYCINNQYSIEKQDLVQNFSKTDIDNLKKFISYQLGVNNI